MREFLLLHLNASSNHDLGPGYFEETQFFAGSNYDKGVEWYRQLFNASSEKAITIFEKSANYFDNPKAPEAIHYLIPNAKIVILLIDPIERAFSWYQVSYFHHYFVTINNLLLFILAHESPQQLRCLKILGHGDFLRKN